MSRAARLSVAAAQMAPVRADLAENLARHRALIADARGQGARVIVFPELSLTGYQVGPRVPELAMAATDSRLATLARDAGDDYVLVGFVEEDRAARFFNAVALLHRGAVVACHRKHALPTYGNLDEGKYFAPGRSLLTCALPGGFTAAPLICADLWDPALVHAAAVSGATLLLAPANSALDAVSEEFSNPGGWSTVLDFYALVYGLPIVFCNRVGQEGGASFWGGSRILDPGGACLVTAPAGAEAAEAVIVAELDFERVRRARFELPTVRDADPGPAARAGLTLTQIDLDRSTE
ncbi:nitrilase-related carbon-nitrogen hydrolase [Haliangium sp.]|uniref:nitrilase-related carbon-nitrogen hydrolase n=1 Tax=Haliangium sp. TaxID=2663208 RepID=UPI003D0AEFDB